MSVSVEPIETMALLSRLDGSAIETNNDSSLAIGLGRPHMWGRKALGAVRPEDVPSIRVAVQERNEAGEGLFPGSPVPMTYSWIIFSSVFLIWAIYYYNPLHQFLEQFFFLASS